MRLAIAVAVLLLAAGIAALGWRLVGEDTRGADVETVEIDSRHVPGMDPLPVTLVEPAGIEEGERRPLLVFLHGRGEDGHESNLGEALYAALEELGDDAPVVAFPSGGVSSYWHDRDGGDWERYVVGEVIPLAARRMPVDLDRVAIGGISMGGFGALHIARRHPGRFCAVGAHSPALWRSGAETAPGAFDDAEDFARHDVVGAARSDPEAFTSQPLWIDVGRSDPFVPGVRAFAEGLGIEPRVSDGGHDADYWRAHLRAYLRFYAESCSGDER